MQQYTLFLASNTQYHNINSPQSWSINSILFQSKHHQSICMCVGVCEISCIHYIICMEERGANNEDNFEEQSGRTTLTTCEFHYEIQWLQQLGITVGLEEKNGTEYSAQNRHKYIRKLDR